MLSYFPTPYPHEWWYSVLCRYHVRSGNWQSQTTTRELFPGRVAAPIGVLLPNSTIKQVIDQLPRYLDITVVIQEHTLFNYHMRFYTEGEKRVALRMLERGEKVTFNGFSMKSKGLWRPQYCPVCMQEDRQTYGEAYWHIEHQILVMSVCPKHGCRLVRADIDPKRLKYTYYPLEGLRVQALSDDAVDELSVELSKILEEYLRLPLEYAVVPDYNNLAIALSNRGYGVIQQTSDHILLDGKRLYHDLMDTYGELALRLFGDKSAYMINRLCKWQGTSPERYALLQHFTGLGCEELFGPKIDDMYDTRLKEALIALHAPTRQQLSDAVGITPAQLNILLKRNGIEPPWQREKTASHKQIRVWLGEEEWDQFQSIMHEQGERYSSEFARKCILSEITRRKNE